MFFKNSCIFASAKKEKEIQLWKAIPTLYGNEARRFRDMADETERKYDLRPKRDISVDPRYKAMRKILERSNITY